MGSGPVTSLYTAEFRKEFAHETARLWRWRLRWYLWTWGGLLVFSSLVGWLTLALGGVGVSSPFLLAWEGLAELTAGQRWALAGFQVLMVGLLGLGWWYAERPPLRESKLVRVASVMVFVIGATYILRAGVGLPPQLGLLIAAVSHLLASSIFPWTPKQALRPAAAMIMLYAVVRFTRVEGLFTLWEAIAAVMIGGVMIGLPGTMISWARHSRRTSLFTVRHLQRRYGEVRRELGHARRIHEALFPPVIEEGALLLDYRYEPMRAIGGDFLFVHRGKEGDNLSVVLADVTGHGIPAALTVNRLHGELSRLFAEEPNIRPGALLRSLNRYVHLTLSDHSVYMTAICFRFDPERDALEYASGGHPPAFLLGVDGSIEELRSTAIVLGACPDADFEPGATMVRFGPGDRLVAYTDGATEARDADGRLFGVERLRACLLRARGEGVIQQVERTVDRYRAGAPDDDTLLLEVSRPVGRGVREGGLGVRAREDSEEPVAV